jgi:hypothetical protein
MMDVAGCLPMTIAACIIHISKANVMGAIRSADYGPQQIPEGAIWYSGASFLLIRGAPTILSPPGL